MPSPTPASSALSTQTAEAALSDEATASGFWRWMPIGGLALLLLALTRQVANGLSDPDAPWHVVAGRELAGSWSFAGPDPLSEFGREPWIMTQWLPELLMAAVYRAGGLPAVSWLAYMATAALCVVLYFVCRRWGGHLAAVIATGMAALGAAGSLGPRPQVVGLAFLVLATGAWLGTAGDHRPRWWLVPLSWVWACSHGTWILGPCVGLVVVAGLTADRRLSRSQAWPLGLTVLGSLAAGLATPIGLRAIESLAAVRSVSHYITEWQRASLTSPSTQVVLLMALVVVLTWRRAARPSWVTVGLIAFGVIWTLWHERTVAVGAVLMAPLVAEALSTLVGRGRPAVDRSERIAVICAATLGAALAAALAALSPSQMVGVPHEADRALDALPTRAVVFNTDSLGGWLMLEHPRVRQTFDTRVEVYGPDGIANYFVIMRAQPGWEERFDSFTPSAALVEDSAPLARALQEQRGWKVTSHGEGYVLLQPADR